MGYINIPKLISGGGDEPVITARDMPQDWQYFKTLKESANDQAYLMFQGGSNTFTIGNLSANMTVTIYGGSNGTTPLYRFIYASSTTKRKWYHWDGTDWVANTTQPTSTNKSAAKFIWGDMDNYPTPFLLTLDKLTGKQITDDPHLGTTQLFTVIVHKPNAVAESVFIADSFNGGSTSAGAFAIPVVAYSGYSSGIKRDSANVNIYDLEFVEFLGGTDINDDACQYATYLTKISVPNTVTTLGVDAFKYDLSLQEAEIGSGITAIPTNMFYLAYNLKKVTLNGNVTSIGSHAFDSCFNLQKMNIPNSVTVIDTFAFYQSGFKKLTSVPNLAQVNERAFANSNIEEVNLTNSSLVLGEAVFNSCHNLKKLTLPSGLTAIPNNTCYFCYALDDVNIPSTVTSIGDYAFSGCRFKEISLPSGLVTIGDYAFTENKVLKKISIPNTVTTIGSNFCEYNTALEEATIGTGLTAIPNYMFNGCTSLRQINIPEGITSIGIGAFTKCVSLRKIELPSTITSIESTAFSTCSGAAYIKLKSATAPTLANVSAFSVPNTFMKILVPYESITSYQTSTNWSSTTSQVKARQRGYGTFTQGQTLPTTSGSYTLTWYDDLDAVLRTTYSGTPTATPVTVASHDGEYWCKFA